MSIGADDLIARGHFAAAAAQLEGELGPIGGHPYRAAGARLAALARAAVQTTLGTCLWQLARFLEAERHLSEALAAREHWQASHTELAETTGRLAAVHHYLGQLPRARLGFERSVALCEQAADLDMLTVARRNLGILLRDQRLFDRGRALLSEALTALRARFGQAHPEVAATVKAIAYLEGTSGEPGLALRAAQQALEASSAAHGDEHPWVAAAHLLVGRGHTRLHHQGKAERSLARAQLLFSSSHGPRHPLTAITVSALASLAWQKKDREHAERLMSDAVERYCATYDHHPYLAGMLAVHAGYLVWLDRLEEAQQVLERGLACLPDSPDWHRRRRKLLTDLSEVRLHLGDAAGAERLTAEAAALAPPRVT